MVVSHHVGAGNGTLVLRKNSQYSCLLSHLSSLTDGWKGAEGGAANSAAALTSAYFLTVHNVTSCPHIHLLLYLPPHD